MLYIPRAWEEPTKRTTNPSTKIIPEKAECHTSRRRDEKLKFISSDWFCVYPKQSLTYDKEKRYIHGETLAIIHA